MANKNVTFLLALQFLFLKSNHAFSQHGGDQKRLKIHMTHDRTRSRRQWIKEQVFTLTQIGSLSGNVGKSLNGKVAFFGVVQSTSLPLLSAAETVGKDENCDSPQCLGVWGGLLANCPHDGLPLTMGAGCASSQDDTPGVFAEP